MRTFLGVLGAALLCLGLAWPESFRHTYSLDATSAAPESGHAYLMGKLPLPDAALGDENAHPERSRIELFEDGRSLGPAHSVHDDIRKAGSGRFSHWGRQLVFSTSDNTDPRGNGRRYEVAFTRELPAAAGWALVLAGVALAFWAALPAIARAPGNIREWLKEPARLRRAVAGLGMALMAAAFLVSEIVYTVPLEAARSRPEKGYAYVLDELDLPAGPRFAGDDAANPTRSPFVLRENGRALQPTHSEHDGVRYNGGGAHSHWGTRLYFSASDHSDPRKNGRVYDFAYADPVPKPLRWVVGIVGALLVLYSQRRPWAQELRVAREAFAGLDWRALLSQWKVPMLLLGALAALVLAFGTDRSAWILITQPIEISHSANSLLGYSWIQQGHAVHKENYSAFFQVALFSGYEVAPDLYFRRPVYTFLATLLSPVLGVATSLLALNLVGWAAAAWLCHRFTMRFYGDAQAARWATLLATCGIGFVVHVMDLSAHLLSFTFYFGGVVLVLESEAWRRRVGARAHAVIALYLMVACLQYNTGIALVAAYVLVSFRRNSPILVLGTALAALAAQPAWGWIVGEMYFLQTGVRLPDLSITEREYLLRALDAWRKHLALPPLEAVAFVARTVFSFAFFEGPLVVMLGALNLLADVRRGPEARARLLFAAAFIAMPFAAAMVFAPAANARGYLVYGVSIFFFASCGAAIAARGRRLPSKGLPLGSAVVLVSLLWSTAHLVNVLGPAKAYFLGPRHSGALFIPGGWEAMSLTGAEPTPRLFGGKASLAEAGITGVLPSTPLPKYRGPRYAVFASALFAVLAGLLLVIASPLGWRVSLVVTVGLLGASVMAGKAMRSFAHVSIPESSHRIDAGRPQPVVYEISLAESVRTRVVTELRNGRVATLFPAHFTGREPPILRVGATQVPLARWTEMVWSIDAPTLLAALATPNARLSITLSGSDQPVMGGWQRVGLPGRRLVSPEAGGPPTLPAVEIRLLRDLKSGAPVLIAY